jgi:hypothetical protein
MVFISFGALFIAASNNVPVGLGPDVYDASPDTSSSSSGPSGGGSSGLPCDPCTNKHGTRIVAQERTTTTQDGLHWVERANWYDTELKISCAPNLAEDEQIRCLPTIDSIVLVIPPYDTPMYFQYYDPLCETRIVPDIYNQCGVSAKYIRESVDSSMPMQCIGKKSKLYEAGQFVGTGMFYEFDASGVCSQKAATGLNYYVVGAHVPPTTFAPMTEVITP